MRFIGKWLIWIGGLALLYVDLRPLVLHTLDAYRAERSIGVPLQDWLLEFARPVFVLGVLCAAALPELGRRKERKKAKAAAVPLPTPSAPADASPPPVPPSGLTSAS
jgi:hypothetical protein